MDPESQMKRETLEGMLQDGMTKIHVTTQTAGLYIPAHLRASPTVAFNLSWRFQGSKMQINEWGVRATLSFQGTDFDCAFPWQAIFIMAPKTGRAVGWEVDPHVALETHTPAVAKQPSHLKLVKN